VPSIECGMIADLPLVIIVL